jgi:hypothetical protein
MWLCGYAAALRRDSTAELLGKLHAQVAKPADLLNGDKITPERTAVATSLW